MVMIGDAVYWTMQSVRSNFTCVFVTDSDVAMLWNDDAMWWCATDDASFGVL